jgi:hypothetical protein
MFLIVMVTLIDGRDRQHQIPATQIIHHSISRHDIFLFETLSTPWCRKGFRLIRHLQAMPVAGHSPCARLRHQGRDG